MLAEVHAVMAENRGALRGGLENVEELTTDLQTSVDNLNDITGKLARGEGTMGKLLNSDQAHEQLVGALESVESGVEGLTQSLGKVNKMRARPGDAGRLPRRARGRPRRAAASTSTRRAAASTASASSTTPTAGGARRRRR